MNGKEKEKEKFTDYFQLKFNSGGLKGDTQYLEFQDVIFGTTYNCEDLFFTLTEFREKLFKKGISGVTLQHYRSLIFVHSGINKSNDRITVYNILETWCDDANKRFHAGNKKKLFKSFLKECKRMVVYLNNKDKLNGFNVADNLAKGLQDVDKSFADAKDEIGQLKSPKNNNGLNPNLPKKFTARHYALTYLFELAAEGGRVPTSDGGLNQKMIVAIGNERMGKNGSGFVKEVRRIQRDFDLNNERDLNNISQNWKAIVLFLSNYNEKIINYLKIKEL